MEVGAEDDVFADDAVEFERRQPGDKHCEAAGGCGLYPRWRTRNCRGRGAQASVRTLTETAPHGRLQLPPAEVWIPTVLFGADVDLLAANAVSSAGEGQHLDAVVGVLLQAVQLQRGLNGGHIPDFPQFCTDDSKPRLCCQPTWLLQFNPDGCDGRQEIQL